MTRHFPRRPLVAAALILATAIPASAARLAPGGENARWGGEFVRMAQGGCSAAASQAAAQSGGQVLSVQTAQRGGRTVCVVTVLIPASDGNRPRRQTITIEQ